MSVFRLQEWWSIKMSDTEEFDMGCMVVGNLDNAPPPLSGMLYLFIYLLTCTYYYMFNFYAIFYFHVQC